MDRRPKITENIAMERDINLAPVSHHLFKLKEHEFEMVVNPIAPGTGTTVGEWPDIREAAGGDRVLQRLAP